jgi:hypothetical protein
LEDNIKSSQLSLARSRNLSTQQLEKLDKDVTEKMDPSKFGYLFGRRKAEKLRKTVSQKAMKFGMLLQGGMKK